MNSNEAIQTISFRPLQLEDIEILHCWHTQAHIQEFFTQRTHEQVQTRYEAAVRSDWEFPFLILLGDKPIGFIEGYMTWREGDGWWPNEEEGTFGIDIWIGEVQLLNRGLGTRIVSLFLKLLFLEFEAKSVVLDVKASNPRAIACYEKAGFRRISEEDTPEGRAVIMRCLSTSFSSG